MNAACGTESSQRISRTPFARGDSVLGCVTLFSFVIGGRTRRSGGMFFLARRRPSFRFLGANFHFN